MPVAAIRIYSINVILNHSRTIQVDRYTKTKKTIYTGFELFSLKERDIPMEVLELPNKQEKIIDFAWEPKVPIESMGIEFSAVNVEGCRIYCQAG